MLRSQAGSNSSVLMAVHTEKRPGRLLPGAKNKRRGMELCYLMCTARDELTAANRAYEKADYRWLI